MTVADLELLYDYGYWANRHLFQVLSQLPASDFTKSVAGSYGSIRNTLVHLMSAEWGWLDRCGGPQRGPSLRADDFADLESVVVAWRQVEGHVRGFLRALKDEDLGRVIEFQLGSGRQRSMRMGELLHHSTVHGAHHRGQVALLLRLMGHTPGNFDILFYYAEKAGVTS
jgi:uncharacterized damage-inducible protein DinB